MDREAWQATLHAVAKSRTQLSDSHTHTHTHTHTYTQEGRTEKVHTKFHLYYILKREI